MAACARAYPDPVGLLTYQLASGRRCVGYVCHAGVEHTGRGGQRVYTHMVLLDQAAYRSFNSNPVQVHAAIGEIVRSLGPMLKPPPHIEPLSLTLPQPGEPACKSLSAAPVATNWIGAIVADLFANHRLLLTGETHPLSLLEWALLSMPRDLREGVNASVEVRFSPSRGMHLVLFQNPDPQLSRQLAGQDIHVLRSQHAPSLPASLEPWFRLLQRWWSDRRFADIMQLTTNTCAEAQPQELAALAALCQDADAIGSNDATAIQSMADRYASSPGQTQMQQTLIDQIQDKVGQRLAQLQQPAEPH